MLFNLSPIFALVPLIIYIILSFKDLNPVLNVVICVILSAIITKQPFSSFGSVMAESLGSFLGMIGFIIMLGSGLGAVLQKTGVAEYLVMSLVKRIGVDNEKKAIATTMVSSTILVSLLGTLAGANAIIAPIIIPLVATIGITPSTVAVVFMGAGLTGTIHTSGCYYNGSYKFNLCPIYGGSRSSLSCIGFNNNIYYGKQGTEENLRGLCI